MERILFFSFLFILTLSLYNVYIIKWGTGVGDPSLQMRLWHIFGWIVRFIPVVFIAWMLWGQWFKIIGFAMIYLHLGWTMYDGVMNWGRGLNFFYQGSKESGTGSWIDRNIGRYGILITKLVILLATVAYIIIIPIF